jgi:mannose/fructose/N-acetylgalactosamine-specific phosphotransferase system component IIC
MRLSPFNFSLTLKSPLVVGAIVAVCLCAVAWPQQPMRVRLAGPLLVLFLVLVTYGFWFIALSALAKMARRHLARGAYIYISAMYYCCLCAALLSPVAAALEWQSLDEDLPKWVALVLVPTALCSVAAIGGVIRANYGEA